MSSDNYYTLRQHTDSLWYLFHGFASTLEDGFQASRVASPGFATADEARAFYREQPRQFMENYYSEYGLLQEPPLEELLAKQQGYFTRWPEELAEEWAAPYRAAFEASQARLGL